MILCNTRELAFQIKKEFDRFTKYLPEIRNAVFYRSRINNKESPEVDYSFLLPLNLSDKMARFIMLEPSTLPPKNLWQAHHHL